MIEAVVFDIGGVIVELGDYSELVGSREMTEIEFWTEWLSCEAAADFESGRIGGNEFAALYVAQTETTLTESEFLEAFLGWPKGLYPGVAELVRGLDERLTVACLSNTNALHWMGQIDAEEVRALFDRQYLSFELGLVKPGKAIFEYLVADLGLDPASILYIDDNQINVKSAVSVGLVARRAKGPEAVAEVLSDVLGN